VARQLTLDLALRPALGRDDFLVTPSNAAAVALVDQWPKWPAPAAVLVGSAGSGKSHLSEVWRKTTTAQTVFATDLTISAVPVLLQNGALLIENVEPPFLNEAALFHTLNLARQQGASLLLTAAHWPPEGLKVPDLLSRLKALPTAVILPPDDALLRGVLVKLFNDRQLAVDEALISFLVTRMPRSLDMARQLVARIDATALEQGAEITRAFASKTLAELENPDFL
jgi:chromosomal replication initiation ATPase DnaA